MKDKNLKLVKVITGFIVLGFLFNLCIASVSAYASDVQVSVSNASGKPGENIHVPITVMHNTAGILSIDIALTYDSQLLHVEDVATGTLTGEWRLCINNEEEGLVRIGLYSDHELNAGEGSIAVIKFVVKTTDAAVSGASCPLVISEAYFSDLPPASINNGTFTVIGAPTYTLTINAVNGTVTKDPNLNAYPSGTVVSLTANPNTGYNFSGWSVDLSGTTNPATITMDANKTVTANFTIKTFTITASAGTGGTISPPGVVTVNYGASKEFTVTPNTGYNISQVLVDGVAVTLTAGKYTFTSVAANHTISATFTAIPTYTLTINAVNGTVTKDPNLNAYPSGTVVSLTANPNTGYSFNNWSGSANGTLNPLTITMDSNKNITANFNLIQSGFSIIATPTTVYHGDSLTISWSVPAEQTNPGDLVGILPVSAIPADGQSLDKTKIMSTRFTNNLANGSVKIFVMFNPGEYAACYLRYHNQEYILPVASAPFFVAVAMPGFDINGTCQNIGTRKIINLNWVASSELATPSDKIVVALKSTGLQNILMGPIATSPNTVRYMHCIATNGAGSGSASVEVPAGSGPYKLYYLLYRGGHCIIAAQKEVNL